MGDKKEKKSDALIEVADVLYHPRHLKYQSPPEVPSKFWEEVRKIVGINPHTGLPYVRFIWGMDRTDYADGLFVRRYPDVGNIYVGAPYWVMEGWQPPTIYNQMDWKRNEKLLGEFPHNGVWDFIAFVRNSDMSFRPLDDRALNMCRQWKAWRQHRKAEAINDIIALRQRLLEREKKLADANTDEDFEKMYDDIHRVEDRPLGNAYSFGTGVPVITYQSGNGRLILPPGIKSYDKNYNN